MQLSTIIVNYNSKRFLENCLNSLLAATQHIKAETIIIDNNSNDGSWDYINSLPISGKTFRLNDNGGFATACNQGFVFAQGKYVLFLNPDTILTPNSLKDCISFLESHEDAGAVGVRMIDGDGKYLKESKRGLPTPAASFYKLFGLAAIFPRSKLLAKYYQGHLPENENNPVEVLSGAFMMIKREVFEKTGGFDTRFFMYGEDIDLSVRIEKAGYRNYYLGRISITHFKRGSTTYDRHHVKVFYDAMNLFVDKHYADKPSWYVMFLHAGISLRKKPCFTIASFPLNILIYAIPHIIVYSPVLLKQS